MEIFESAKAVRLRSHHGKYLMAEGDELSVTQARNGSYQRAWWAVELAQGGRAVRLRGCFGRYLAASGEPFFLGMGGRKVLQTPPAAHIPASWLEWEPVRDGPRVRLRSHLGKFLRANGGLPPWRGSVTHDVPTRDCVLWHVDVLETELRPEVWPPYRFLALPAMDALRSHHRRRFLADVVVVFSPLLLSTQERRADHTVRHCRRGRHCGREFPGGFVQVLRKERGGSPQKAAGGGGGLRYARLFPEPLDWKAASPPHAPAPR